jgi:predicted outer membrane protein
MHRRTTLIAPIAMLGTAALLKTQAAHATTMSSGSYTTQVLQYGTLSKETSRIARANTSTHNLFEFATGEILEQTAIAQSLTGMASPKPAKLSAAQQADLAKVQDATPADFDQTYLTVQIQGHEALLQLQEEFLGSNPVYGADLVHIALIATAFIKNHLYILRNLKNGTL